jgi:hypothetical protein
MPREYDTTDLNFGSNDFALVGPNGAVISFMVAVDFYTKKLSYLTINESGIYVLMSVPKTKTYVRKLINDLGYGIARPKMRLSVEISSKR